MKRRIVKKKWNREVRELKKDLKRSEYSIDKVFTSYECYHPNVEFTWSDIYFIGTYEGHPRVFNCTIVSAIDDFESKVDQIVSDKMDQLYPKRYENTDIDWGDPKGEGKYQTRQMNFITHDKELQAKMDSKEDEILQEVLENGEVKVRSYVQALPDFQYGVGLDIVTEEKMLTKEIVIEYVKKIQQLNVTGFDKIYLSDKEIQCSPEDHHRSKRNGARLICA